MVAHVPTNFKPVIKFNQHKKYKEKEIVLIVDATHLFYHGKVTAQPGRPTSSKINVFKMLDIATVAQATKDKKV